MIPKTLNEWESIDFLRLNNKNWGKSFSSSLDVVFQSLEYCNDSGSLQEYNSLQYASSCQVLPSSPSCDIKVRLTELTTYTSLRKYRFFRNFFRLIQRKKNVFIYRNNNLFCHFYISKFIRQVINYLCSLNIRRNKTQNPNYYRKFKQEECWRRALLEEILIISFFNQPIVKQEQKVSKKQPSLFDTVKNTNNFVIKSSTSTCPMTPVLQSPSSSMDSASLPSTNYTLLASKLFLPFFDPNQLSPGDFQSSPEKTSILYTGDENLNSNISFSPDNCKFCIRDTYLNGNFSPKKLKNENWDAIMV
ncbi:hypothetical protein PCANB_001586 [Pneumocystis canis]|nr:hypothetical protein PCK1_001460 [Pneumocystis canis]KAG5439287.1 hypothetical protein PCANB_001586 [Pneumocystis canis]